MPVLPFHKYVGPGNPSDNGEPVDEDDRIAKVHDIQYDQAKSVEDIRKADVEAIYNFRKDWREGNWHSFIGDAGLSIKYFIESYTGVLYPKFAKLQTEHNCEILHIKNILNLHCVFKSKPFLDKYESNVLAPSENLDYSEYDLVSQRKIDTSKLPNYFYVPLEWTELFVKYGKTPLIWSTCVYCAQNLFNNAPCIKKANKKNKVISHKYNSQNTIKSDLFNINFWLNISFLQSMREIVQVENTKIKEEFYELDLFRVGS